MADLFVSTDLNTLYNTNVRLLYFRDNAAKITTDALTADIESLDRRIATFEKVTLPSASTTAAADADFPYDREGLKREFMQEVVALLIRSSSPILTAGGEFDLEKTTLLVGGTRSEAGSVGGTHRSITYAATDSAGGATNFDTRTLDQLRDTFGVSHNGTDTKEIFNAYSQLIDAVFAEGDKIATATSDPVQVVTAIPAVTIGGVLYDRMATVSTGSIKLGEKTIPTAPLQYLLEATAGTSSVTQGTELTAGASAPGSPLFPVAGSNINARRLLLKPEEATAISNTLYTLTPLDVTSINPKPALTVTLTRDSAGRVQNFEDISLSLNGTALTLDPTPVHIPLRRDPLNLATLDQITAAATPFTAFDSSFTVANDLNTAFSGTLLDAVGWDGDNNTFGPYMVGKFGSGTSSTLGSVYWLTHSQFIDLDRAFATAMSRLSNMPDRSVDATLLAIERSRMNSLQGIGVQSFRDIRAALVGNGGTQVSTTDSSKLQPKAEPRSDRFAGPRATLLSAVSDMKATVRSGALPPYGTAVLNAYNAAQSVITNVNATSTTTGDDVIDKNALIAQANALIAALQVSTDLVGADVGDPDNIPTSRRFTANGTSYILSLNAAQDRVFVTSLGPVRRSVVDPVQSLTAPQYLYHLNEVRINILRGKMSYQEAVVREIQEDLRRANEALADLEKQSGAVTDASGTSAETLTLGLFNAMASTPGKSILSRTGGDARHNQSEWAANRTALKNYIDRRSSEAQQATLDYQNILNRYNNAYEVMSKMQEKIDNLLKGQLRNFG